MPFEPLQTDEVLEAPAKRERDMDTQMLFGCTSFVGASFITYGLAIWPFFVIDDQHLTSQFLLAAGLGGLPALAFGVYCARKYGLAGGCGFFGGATAVGIFHFLHLQQLMIGHVNREIPEPEFPESWKWIVPTIWLVVALAMVLAFLRRSEFGDSTGKSGSR